MAMSQSELIKKHFDSMIDDYDTESEAVVPWNEEIQKCVYEDTPRYLSFAPGKEAIALDLGIGTASGIVKYLPNADCKFVGVDFSHKMLEKAKRNLAAANLSDEVGLICEDFSKWEFPVEKFDVCFSTIAIHTLTDEDKKVLFKNIYKCLKPGGVFINGDFVRSESPLAQAKWNEFYRRYMEQQLHSNELSVWLWHVFHDDKPATAAEQKQWLKEADFKEFEVLWRKRNLAVYFAKK